MQWNLSCLAQALIPLLVDDENSTAEKDADESIAIETINQLL
jgi:uncharacterized protein YdiU (UPF0061 family)